MAGQVRQDCGPSSRSRRWRGSRTEDLSLHGSPIPPRVLHAQCMICIRRLRSHSGPAESPRILSPPAQVRRLQTSVLRQTTSRRGTRCVRSGNYERAPVVVVPARLLRGRGLMAPERALADGHMLTLSIRRSRPMLPVLFATLGAFALSGCIGIAPPPFIPPPVLPERDSTPEAIDCLDDKDCPEEVPPPAVEDEPVNEDEPWRYVLAACSNRGQTVPFLPATDVDFLWAHSQGYVGITDNHPHADGRCRRALLATRPPPLFQASRAQASAKP